MAFLDLKWEQNVRHDIGKVSRINAKQANEPIHHFDFTVKVIFWLFKIVKIIKH